MRNIQARRAVFYGFIVLFFISAPAIVFFTAGFRWSMGQGITRTGTIFVASVPKNATIFLNDNKYKETTPAVIKRQKPAVWQVRLELEDHFTWQKNLAVLDGTTTFIDNVILFLDTKPHILVSDNMANASWSSDRTSIAWADHQEGWTEIWISNIERPASLLVSRFPLNKDVEMSWINNDMLSISREGATSFVQKNGESVDVSNEPTSNTKIVLSNGNIDVTDTATNTIIARLPFGEYTIIDERGPYITLKDTLNNKIALLLRSDTSEPLLLLEDATSAQWLREEVLLIASPFSISIYEPSKHLTTLITRISNEIKDPQWHPDGGYIFYETENSVRVIELDDRDGRLVTILANMDDINGITIDESGKSLYIVGSDGVDNGLFVRDLYKK